MRQIAQGLEYLHEKKFVHRDIKPENILAARGISSHEVILRIGDFCNARCLHFEDDKAGQMDSIVGTKKFQAPEYFGPREQCVHSGAGRLLEGVDTYVDMFSFGLIILALWQIGKDTQGNKKLIPVLPKEMRLPTDMQSEFGIGCIVFEDKGEKSIEKLIPEHESSDDALADLIMATLKYDKDERWTARQIIKYFIEQKVSERELWH